MKTKLPSPQERLELILLGLARRVPVRELCRQAGVSRELFYRWLKKVRGASLKALQTQAPGPKEKLEEDTQEQVRRLRQRIVELEKRGRTLRRERDHLKDVAKTAERIIRRNCWKMPDTECKKNGMRTKKNGNGAFRNGRSSNPPVSGPGSSPNVWGSIGARSGDGSRSQSNPEGQGA